MLDKISQLTSNCPENKKWIVKSHSKKSRIELVDKSSNSVANLIDMIRVVRFANKAILAEKQNLTKTEAQQIFASVAKESISIQDEISHKNLFTRLALKIASFFFTHSSLSKSTNTFRKDAVQTFQLDNQFAAKLKYVELMKDAEMALTNLESYEKIAEKYPALKRKSYSHLYNPILHHMRTEISHNWLKLRDMVKEGKTIDDPAFVDLCDINMQLCLSLGKLSLMEVELCYEKKEKGELDLPLYYDSSSIREQALGSLWVDQRLYPWIGSMTVFNFYIWVRSCPKYDSGAKGDQQWLRTAKDNPLMDAKFYTPGTPQFGWRNQWNNHIQNLKAKIDIEWMLKQDEREYVDEDVQNSQTTLSSAIYRNFQRDHHLTEEIFNDKI